jgi:hypothetical protein
MMFRTNDPGSRPGVAALGLDPGSVIGRDGDFGQAVAGVRQADVDALPLSRNASLEESGQRADGRMQRGGAVDEGIPARMGGMPSSPVTMAMPDMLWPMGS